MDLNDPEITVRVVLIYMARQNNQQRTVEENENSQS